MPSSIYPDAIDGYAQIPLVVDKQTPVNADSVNCIREAIINVQTELGVNPSGDFNSVVERLNSVGVADADQVPFDPSTSVLISTNVQDAIDEIARPGVIEVSSTYIVQDNDEVILVDASLGPVIICLPSASGLSRYHHIKKVDESSNLVTVTPMAGQTVDGSSSGIIINASYDTYTVLNDESDSWFII
jgi:hypothetical protein